MNFLPRCAGNLLQRTGIAAHLTPASTGSNHRWANSLPKSLPAGTSPTMVSILLEFDHSLLCHAPDHGNPVLKSTLFVQLAETQSIRYYGTKMIRFHADRYG